MEDIVERVLEVVGPEEVVGDKALPLEEHVPVPISMDNFSGIPDGKGSIAFVDGGNAELLGASSFSLQFVRSAIVPEREKEEFYLLIIFRDGEFTIETFPEGKLPELSFDSRDPRLRTGNERVVAAKVGGVCRRLFELQKAMEAAEKYDYVVIDGDLYARASQEEKLLKKLKDNVAGLSKTSGLMTEKGRVFAAALSGLKTGAWIYSPVFEGGEVDVSFIKLHPSSDYVFRLDQFRPSDELLGILKAQAYDAAFPGYPYGLLEADRLARISNRDREYLRMKFMTRFGKGWKNVKTYLNTGNAHDILDNIGP